MISSRFFGNPSGGIVATKQIRFADEVLRRSTRTVKPRRTMID
jgi:hypothetical protein